MQPRRHHREACPGKEGVPTLCIHVSNQPTMAASQETRDMSSNDGTTDQPSGAATHAGPAGQPRPDPLDRPSTGGRPGRAADRGPAGLVRGRDQLAELRAADARGTPRTSRPRRLLDLHVHQLAADGPVPSGVGREIRRRRPHDRRRPYPRVRLRAGPRQRRSPNARASASSTRSRSTATTASGAPSTTTSGRPLYLADARGTNPLPPLRRGRVRDDRDGRSSSC